MSQKSLLVSQAELWAPGVPSIARPPPAARLSEVLSQSSASPQHKWSLQESLVIGLSKQAQRWGSCLGRAWVKKLKRRVQKRLFSKSWLQFLLSFLKPR